MATFEINLDKSIYKPITVRVKNKSNPDGKLFQVRRIDQGALAKLMEHDRECAKGVNEKAVYDRLRFLLNTTDGLIAKCELREINAITNFITKHLYRPEEADPEEKK